MPIAPKGSCGTHRVTPLLRPRTTSVATFHRVKRLAAALSVAALLGHHGHAASSTVPLDDPVAAAYDGLRTYLASIDDTELTDDDGFVVGECPLLGADEFGVVASQGSGSEYVVDLAVITPLTIERFADRVSVQCSFSGGVVPGVLRADITVLDLGVSPEIERQLDQAMRGAPWTLVDGPVPGALAGRCYARRDRDDCPIAWKRGDLAVLIELSFGKDASDVGQARLVFGGLLRLVLSSLADAG